MKKISLILPTLFLALLGAVSLNAQTDSKIFLPIIYTSSQATLLPNDAHTLALFPLEGNTQDISGNNRDATLINGTFVSTPLGQGLQLAGIMDEVGQGFQWNSYAGLLVHPYTIEMLVTPEQTSSYAKLFGANDASDGGWYYRSEGISSYPFEFLGLGQALPNEQHYIAFVSTDTNGIDIYLQGVFLGTSENHFTDAPAEAVFFNDDSGTLRREQLAGVVEEVRISNVSRTAVEIQAIQNSR